MTKTGSVPELPHPKLITVPAGTELWHVFPRDRLGDSFNPVSTARFSARNADPPRAMYYAADEPEQALWETVLRDVIAENGRVALHAAQFSTKKVARVQLTSTAQFVSLDRLALRNQVDAGNPARGTAQIDEWDRLTRTADHAETHPAAAQLLGQHPSVTALQWTSRQAGIGRVFVFYSGPGGAGPTFKVIEEEILVSGPSGWRRIDDALRLANLDRIPTDPGTMRALAGGR